jgi:L-rhamnose mutarotase
MERMGQVISLKQGAVAEYNRLHSAVWAEVLQVIHDANIRNY